MAALNRRLSDSIEVAKEAQALPLTASDKCLFMGGGGAAISQIGSTMEQADFVKLRRHGEPWVAAACVPPIIAGFSEGLDSATYSNYQLARRRFAEGTIAPLWRHFVESMQEIVDPPPGCRLWYGTRDIAFLRDDLKDRPEVVKLKSEAMSTLVTAGYDPELARQPVDSADFRRLQHSGMVPVQLVPPGTETNPASTNGKGNVELQLPEQTH